MDKKDLLILKAFALAPIPTNFYDNPSKIVMVDSIAGLADRVYHGEKLKKSEIQYYDMDNNIKKEIASFLSKSDNLYFYYLFKLVILILYKNSI